MFLVPVKALHALPDDLHMVALLDVSIGYLNLSYLCVHCRQKLSNTLRSGPPSLSHLLQVCVHRLAYAVAIPGVNPCASKQAIAALTTGCPDASTSDARPSVDVS
jgi:hypothetical protein